MKKYSILVIAISLALIVSTSMAEHPTKHKHQNKYVDYAQVANVKPIYKNVRVSSPERECWQEKIRKPVRHHVHDDPAPTIVGSIIGGAIGRKLGKGHDKNASTIAGAVIGAAIGHNASHTSVDTGQYEVDYQRHCQTSANYYTEEQLVGYKVRYYYNGKEFTARMKQYPGNSIKVKVKITPIE